MKTKLILAVIICCAVLTFSFTLASSGKSGSKETTESVAKSSEPTGGLSSEDPLK